MKTGTFLGRITAFLMAVVLCVTITYTTSFAKAKAKPALSDTSLTLRTNENDYISLKNASSKVTWKSSDKSIVKIKNTFGKYTREVYLKTGNKTGSCKITARMKNKTYRCKVTVKKGDIIKKYTGNKSKTVLEKVTQTKKSIIIRYKMCAAAYNKKKGDPAGYGYSVQLERYTDGKWSEIPMNIDAAFLCVWCVIPSKTSISREIHLENYYDISLLTKGSYRLDVNVLYPDTKAPYVKFEIK